jgi:hypothetical protein
MKKIREVKNSADPAGWPSDPVDPARPGQKPCCNPLTIFFFNQNNIILIYKKIMVDLDDPVTWSKPVTRVLGRVNRRVGFKNTGYSKQCKL